MEYGVLGIARRISKFTKREIDFLFKHARRAFRGAPCTILLAPRQEAFGRVLVIASRKVGNAPERNLIRRRIKSLFYEEKLYDRAFDCAIIVQKKMVELSFAEIKELILNSYDRAAGRENTNSQ